MVMVCYGMSRFGGEKAGSMLRALDWASKRVVWGSATGLATLDERCKLASFGVTIFEVRRFALFHSVLMMFRGGDIKVFSTWRLSGNPQ